MIQIDNPLASLKDGSLSTVQQWHETISTGNYSIENEVRMIVLGCLQCPEHRVLLLTVFEQWTQKQYPKIMASVAQPVDEPPPHTVNRFRVDDLLYLEPRTTDAAVLIERFGHWWKFQAGRKTGLECLLRSVHGKQKRSEPKSKVEMLVIGKAGDWRYDVTNMIPFPCGEADIPKAGK